MCEAGRKARRTGKRIFEGRIGFRSGGKAFSCGKTYGCYKNSIIGREPPDREQVYDAIKNALSTLDLGKSTLTGSPGAGKNPMGGLSIEDNQLDEVLRGFTGEILHIAEKIKGLFKKESLILRPS